MYRKAKRFAVMIMPVLIIACLGSLSGCGDSNSADPLGTGIIQFYDATTGTVITSITIQPGGTYTLIVKVRNLRSDGTSAPVINERVTFTLLTPVNGGSLTVVNDRTAGDGQAMAVYAAGNNFASDSVRATTSAGATATITINKQGGIIGARIATLAASSTSVADGETSVITATVTNGNANPMMGEAVAFTLATNDSHACFIDASKACVPSVTISSDASGHAAAVYHAGANRLSEVLHDTVRAALSNGSSNAVTITRTAVAPVGQLAITVTAAPASVGAGQASIITATVTGGTNAGAGETVSFTLPVNNSGATLSATSATTDGKGNAVVTYQPGTQSPALSVSDTIQATVGTASSSAVITRTATAPLAYTLTISANPATLAVRLGSSVITATLKDTKGTAVSGQTINFACTNGTLPGGGVVATATTDGSGNAVTTYTSTAVAAGTGIVTVTWGTYTNAVVINIP